MKPLQHIAALAAALLSVVCAGPALAQSFPNKPVTIVVPYAAGGPVDNFVRGLTPMLSDTWKQPVVVMNKPGANEIIGADFVAKSAPDGYTLFAGTEAALTMNQHLYKKLPYNPEKDFTEITRMVALPLVFFVPKNSPANTLKEFIALARKNSTTRPMTYGSSGAGGIAHLPMAMFTHNEGLTMVHVPYKGAAPLIPEVIAGQIDAAVLGVSVIEQHVKAGTLKALAVSSDARSAALPDVPTFKELGVKEINAVFNIGLVAPRGTPAEIVEKIARDTNRIVQTPEFKKKYIDAFSYVAVGSTPAEFRDFLARDRKIQGERVKLSGVSLD
ncbi:MAG TPA: tripartite tricarboxylate transporter substrate binding protein [Burkholderiaceae bacterium]|jgi:tripartite-type tricarboxylate transporter receptor subunit TctC|nr:tripartite tricarboxylate transporter substrate binding protein [Burkholderiaceae bacterium]